MCGHFLHAQGINAVLPLDAVKSMATVKLSCVLMGEGKHQYKFKTEMSRLCQYLQMGGDLQLFRLN